MSICHAEGTEGGYMKPTKRGIYVIHSYNISDPALPVIKVESPEIRFACCSKNSSRSGKVMQS
jgi:hypothetical protein